MPNGHFRRVRGLYAGVRQSLKQERKTPGPIGAPTDLRNYHAGKSSGSNYYYYYYLSDYNNTNASISIAVIKKNTFAIFSWERTETDIR